jgi:excinuclease ABC subunit B
MFGKPKFDLPPLPPELVDAIKAAMEIAEQQFTGAEGEKKREFVKGKVKDAAKNLEYERAASLRDRIKTLRQKLVGKA